MSKLFSIIDFLRNHKTLVVILVFFLFICFLDANSLWERHYHWQNISELKTQIADLKKESDKNAHELDLLKSSPAKVEQVARERYYMTRPGEDLFIIDDGDTLTSEAAVQIEDDNDEEPAV